MRHKFMTFAAVVMTTLALLGLTTGCREWLPLSHGVAFGAGWLIRDLTMTTTTETVCYENGVLIDCADLPADLRQ